jgi:EAL domain-containing protein (putative c-di-GMP-specific phosphodiesterase class I)
MSSGGPLRAENVPEPTRVHIVDDDVLVARALQRLLTREGWMVTVSHDVESALHALEKGAALDVIVSDVSMPGTGGLDLLRRVKEVAPDLPVILITCAPNVDDAARALEYGAFRYLTKPVSQDALCGAIQEAVRLRRLATAASVGPHRERAELENCFRRALRGMRMVYQPIVDVHTRGVYGYEALMRSSEPTLPSPPAVLDAAERLGSLHLVGRHVRALVAEQARASAPDTVFFVNIHPVDLADPELFESAAPMTKYARRVVLELTERASLDAIADVEARVARLRELGYLIAVDDLGAGYAGLSCMARVRPDVVKIDMSLIRGLDGDPVRRNVVASLCALARQLGMRIVAEGIETRGEREAVVEVGADYVQGYGIARPGPPFPEVRWE